MARVTMWASLGLCLLSIIVQQAAGACTGDKIANCAAYGQAMCSDPQYTAWATDNCCTFCHLSGGTSGDGEIFHLNLGGGTPGPGTSSCTANKIQNCDAYGSGVCTDPQYQAWAADNCCVFCHLGGGSSVGTGPVVHTGASSCGGDKINNCAAYGQAMCSDPQYTAWATDNCCAFCHSGTATGTGAGTGAITGSSTGCVYKGQVYQQGQTWMDGCSFKCSCTDASTGHYQCQDPCYTFNIPPACHMDPPAAGKCCATPNCPAGITIQYPAGYVAA